MQVAWNSRTLSDLALSSHIRAQNRNTPEFQIQTEPWQPQAWKLGAPEDPVGSREEEVVRKWDLSQIQHGARSQVVTVAT